MSQAPREGAHRGQGAQEHVTEERRRPRGTRKRATRSQGAVAPRVTNHTPPTSARPMWPSQRA
jgi:hypothetical protein